MSRRKTILIIEDHEDARFVLGAILNHDGYRVVEAADGEEGLARAIEHLPDLVVLDIRMPGMSGFEVGEALRADSRTRDIPVLAVTADRFDSARLRSVERLFDRCVWKPIEPTRLMDHVRELIGEP